MRLSAPSIELKAGIISTQMTILYIVYRKRNKEAKADCS